MAQTITFPTWHRPTRTVAKRFAGALQSAWTAYWIHRAERATVQMLHSLDDRTLKDIGLDRSEIESVAHNPGHERRVDVQAHAVGRGRHLSSCA